MMPALAAMVAVFLSGLSSKMLDGFRIGKSAKEIAYLAINIILVLAGAFAALTICPEIIIALLVALPLMGKIDRLSLQLAYAAVLIVTALLVKDFSSLNLVAIAVLAIGAAVDETELPFIRDFRPAMLIASIAIGLLLWNWRELLTITLYDLGYVIAAGMKPDLMKMLFRSSSKV
jgi:hypothetical protein